MVVGRGDAGKVGMGLVWYRGSGSRGVGVGVGVGVIERGCGCVFIQGGGERGW